MSRDYKSEYKVTSPQYNALICLRNRLVPLPISVDIIDMFDKILDSIKTEVSLEDEASLDLFKVNE